MEISQLANEELYDRLGTGPAGLDVAEAASRLREHGANEIVEAHKGSMVWRLLANFYHTFALLLWAAGFLAFAAGLPELGWAIFLVVLLNALFSFWQEFQAEKAVEALKKILPARARAVRGGELVEILAAELVPGDIIVLHEGDNISADARLIEENGLRVNAATLTGESEPVRKQAGPATGEGLAVGEVPNLVLAGTSVAFGSGRAVVYATGMGTEFGRIASLTQKVKVEPSPLQREVNRVALLIAAVAVIMGAALFGVAALFTPLSLGVAAVFAIGMLVANVPEGMLPTVTLSLAMAVKRMARKNALVKRLSGVETLGSTTVICTDKTGTLTRNEMTVRQLWADGRLVDVGGTGYEPLGGFSAGGAPLDVAGFADMALLMQTAALCNNARLVEGEPGGPAWAIIGDPTEAALLVAARKWGFDEDAAARVGPRLYELAFDSRRKRMSVVYPRASLGDGAGLPGVDEESLAVYVKGAPRELLSLSSRVLAGGRSVPLDADQRREVERHNDELARAGLRVLAMAVRTVPASQEMTIEAVEEDLTFVGLMAMMDPPRPEVEMAVKRCRRAGVRVIMITGDYGLTAESIAHRIGLLGGGPAVIVNGADLEGMSDEDLTAVLGETRVLFARVSPEHKMRVAASLQAAGEIVAMTGDGVNDAPALKKADIGVAMGIAGTDVAREAATIILTDDNFATIVGAIEEGRVVYDNMRKFLVYIFAHLTPEIIPFIAFVLLGIPLPLVVMQILAIDLGTETLPALALGVERAEPDIMKRPPRPKKERLVDLAMMFRAWVFLGLIEAVLVMGGYFWVLYDNGWSYGQQLADTSHLYLQATTMTFAGIVALQVGTAVACRTNRASVFSVGLWSNRWLLWGIVFEVALLFFIVYLPPLQRVFATAGLELKHWLLLALFPPVLLAAEEARKYLLRKAWSRKAREGSA